MFWHICSLTICDFVGIPQGTTRCTTYDVTELLNRHRHCSDALLLVMLEQRRGGHMCSVIYGRATAAGGRQRG